MDVDLPLGTENEILESPHSPNYNDVVLECTSNLCTCSTISGNNSAFDCTLADSHDASSSTSEVDALRVALNEKEKDLELAAKIGKHLLERNKELQASNDFLEEKISIANEQVIQLKHELQGKIDLLQTFNENESESGGSTPASERRFYSWNMLEKKLSMLEEENTGLKLEISHLKCLTESLAAKETQIIGDCNKQAAITNKQFKELSTKLAENVDSLAVKSGQLVQNRKDIIEKAIINKQLTAENEELTMHLIAAQETQKELAHELTDLRDRYTEVMAMLSEARLQLKSGCDFESKLGCQYLNVKGTGDSLASEIKEATAQPDFIDHLKSKKSTDPCSAVFLDENLSSTNLSSTTLPKSHDKLPNSPLKIFTDLGASSSFSRPFLWQDHLAQKNFHEPLAQVDFPKDETEPSSDEFDVNSNLEPGTPGVPGSKDLHNALKRLSLRKRVEAEYQHYKVKLKKISSNSDRLFNNLHSNTSSHHSIWTQHLAPPQKEATLPHTTVIQWVGKKCLLVKPVQGSEALDQWRTLATPTFDAAIHQPATVRPGIKSKCEQKPDSDLTPPPFFSVFPIGRGGLDSGINSDVESTSSSSLAVRSIGCFSTAVAYSYVNSHVTKLRPFYISTNDAPRVTEFSHPNLPSTTTTASAIYQRDAATMAPVWQFAKQSNCTTHKRFDRKTATSGLLDLLDQSTDGAASGHNSSKIFSYCDREISAFKPGVLSRYSAKL